MKKLRRERLDMLRTRPQLMTPELITIRQELSTGHFSSHAKLHIPTLAEPFDAYGMGRGGLGRNS